MGASRLSPTITSSAQSDKKDVHEKEECKCEFGEFGVYFCSEQHERDYFNNHPELTGYLTTTKIKHLKI